MKVRTLETEEEYVRELEKEGANRYYILFCKLQFAKERDKNCFLELLSFKEEVIKILFLFERENSQPHELSELCTFLYIQSVDCDGLEDLLLSANEVFYQYFVESLDISKNNHDRWSLWNMIPAHALPDYEKRMTDLVLDSILENDPSEEDIESVRVHKS
jgi:hypothetical protein